MKKRRVKVIKGDRVQVRVSPYDTSHGITASGALVDKRIVVQPERVVTFRCSGRLRDKINGKR